jgi:glycine/sarcosine N-methyltransferase
MQPDDPWSRVDYRRLIAWPDRIKREWPFLERILAGKAGDRVIDLGCGTGEHSRALASHGFDVIGVDASRAMLDAACDTPLPPNLHFIEGDIVEVSALVPPGAAGAICLGNTLPHLDEAAMRRLAAGLAATLAGGGRFVFQVLNYDRIRAKKIRHLPLNLRPQEDGSEIVFLRLMDTKPDGTVVFTPTTLRYDPTREPPVEVTSTRSVSLHGWSWPDLRRIFMDAGFTAAEAFGGYDGALLDAMESTDLIGVLTR